MSLREIPLKLEPGSLPPKVQAVVEAWDQRSDAFFDQGYGEKHPNYVASDNALVYSALLQLLEGDHVRKGIFLEWGCGFGVATCVAALIGFEAHGIELEEPLYREAIGLKQDFDVPATILHGDYLPEGFEESDGVGGKDLITPDSSEGFHAEVRYGDLDAAEVDLFFVYPWPGQEELMLDLFRAVASYGAVLLMYLGDDEIEAWIRVDDD